MTFKYQLILSFIGLLLACNKESNPLPEVQGPAPVSWLIPQEEVFDSGIGRDGIPSVDQPKFSTTEEVNPFFDNKLVLGIAHNGVYKAYPIDILNWHEIVNDEVDDLSVAITYCPLTGTGIGWGRKIGSSITTYGVSGFLYNNNLMPYDRQRNSTWSQQRLECVNGVLIGFKPETYTLMMTTFSTWKKSFPDSKVMTAETGFDRRYSEYPYGDYRTNQDLLFFPVNVRDERLPAKERVLGVLIEEAARAYRFNQEEAGTEIIYDQLAGKSLIIVRSAKDNYNTAFLNPNGLNFEAISDNLPSIMKDELGNEYDLSGRIIIGPNQGETLSMPVAFIGYWFSWPAFYPTIEIYEE